MEVDGDSPSVETHNDFTQEVRPGTTQTLEGCTAQLPMDPGELLEERRLPPAGETQASMLPSMLQGQSPGCYWVLQSPSLPWAVFTFLSSFCSSDSAATTSFGF